MADVPSVPPTLPPQPLPALPQTLADLILLKAPLPLTPPPDAPVQIQGTVIAVDLQTKQITVETPQGKIVVQAEAPVMRLLPPQTPVLLELRADASGQKTLVTLTPLLLQKPAVASPLSSTPTTQPPLPPLAGGMDIEALLLKPVSNPTAAPPSLPETTAPKGIIRQLLAAYFPKVLTPEAPAEMPEAPNDFLRVPVQQQAAPPQGQPQASLPSPPLPQGQVPPQASSAAPPLPLEEWIAAFTQPSAETPSFPAAAPDRPLQAFVPLRLHIVTILPPETPPEQAAPPPGAQTAIVETDTPQGFVLLRATDGARFAVRAQAAAPPVGSTVVFEEADAAPATPSFSPAQAAPDEAAALDPRQGREWLALKAVERFLRHPPPDLPAPPDSVQAARQAVDRSLPTPTKQLAPTVLFFLAALRSGAIENWLGAETLKTLRTGKTNIAERLTGDFDRLAAQSREPLPGGEWRVISVPLRHEGELSQMQFYIRQQQEDGGNKGEGEGRSATRFLLNLSLSRMGRMQFDGYLHKKNFDIVLRTEEKLPFDIRQEIMKRFADGLEQVRMQGGISFQTRAQGWIVPDPAARRQDV